MIVRVVHHRCGKEKVNLFVDKCLFRFTKRKKDCVLVGAVLKPIA